MHRLHLRKGELSQTSVHTNYCLTLKQASCLTSANGSLVYLELNRKKVLYSMHVFDFFNDIHLSCTFALHSVMISKSECEASFGDSIVGPWVSLTSSIVLMLSSPAGCGEVNEAVCVDDAVCPQGHWFEVVHGIWSGGLVTHEWVCAHTLEQDSITPQPASAPRWLLAACGSEREP